MLASYFAEVKKVFTLSDQVRKLSLSEAVHSEQSFLSIAWPNKDIWRGDFMLWLAGKHRSEQISSASGSDWASVIKTYMVFKKMEWQDHDGLSLV